jgi:hypothetical protein
MIEEIIREWSSRLPRSSGDNLTGFIMDADWALGEIEGAREVNVNRSDDPHSMVNALVTFEVSALHLIAQGLANAWPSFAYQELAVVSIQRYLEATVMRFITAASGGKLCVTGTVVATSPNYADLADEFDREFGSLGGKLSSISGGLPAWAAMKER